MLKQEKKERRDPASATLVFTASQPLYISWLHGTEGMF